MAASTSAATAAKTTPTSIRMPSLVATLANFRESGLHCDVDFIVGPDKTSIKAHKLVLISRSEVFEPMLETRWNENTDSMIQIELPLHDPNVFLRIIQYMYSDNNSWNVMEESELNRAAANTEDRDDFVIDVLNLGHLYQLPEVVTKCAEYFKARVTKTNCVKTYLVTRNIEACADTNKKAFLLVLKYFRDILRNPGEFSLDLLNTEAWADILQQDDLHVEEVDLFRTVILKGGQKELAHMIRYTLMTEPSFNKVVVPSGVLPKEDVDELEEYFKSGRKLPPPAKFSSTCRLKKIAYDSNHLRYLLGMAIQGDTIHFLPGTTYEGPFTLSQNKVTLQGMSGGTSTIIIEEGNGKTCLSVTANKCKIADIHFLVKVPGSAISVRGNGTKLQNLKIDGSFNKEKSSETTTAAKRRRSGDGGKDGIAVCGDDTCVESVQFVSLFGTGLSIIGKRNNINDITCLDVHKGVVLRSCKDCKVSNLSYTLQNINPKDYYLNLNSVAVGLFGGEKNEIVSITSVGQNWSNGNKVLQCNSESVNSTFKDISGGNVSIDGSKHSIQNIRTNTTFYVGGKNHKLEFCTAPELIWSNLQTEIVGCSFRKVKQIICLTN